MSVQPFVVHVPDASLADLRERLARTRWPDQLTDTGWAYGTDLAYLQDLVHTWQHDFDWRTQETALNRFHHIQARVNSIRLHAVHERGRGPHPLPLVLLHGWPSSIVQLLKIVPLLTDPAGHGGDPADSFDVVAVSLPGYGFSDRPALPGMSVGKIAGLIDTLMYDLLGYARYGARGSDLGAGVLQQLALAQPERLVGLHTGGTNPWIGEDLPDDLSEAEQQFVVAARRWMATEMGYAMVQSTKPQTLAYALNDSPAGLAAWIVEKFRTWSDCDGDLNRAFSHDDLLTNLTIYWVTESIGSSMRLYYESARDPNARWGRVATPTAMAMPPKDMFPTPRAWSERSYNVVRWTELVRGGHFPEWEVPELLADDIRAFFRPMRAASSAPSSH
jgi:pimeloyl-ACP methyl ester carboxylesterase